MDHFLWHLAQSALSVCAKAFFPSWQVPQYLVSLWSASVIFASFFILKTFVWQALHFVSGTFMCFSWLKRTAPCFLDSYLISPPPTFFCAKAAPRATKHKMQTLTIKKPP